jgi:hypothetical protein
VRQDFTEDISPSTGDERNTLGMWGSGAIEMLAREMTADLQAIRQGEITFRKIGCASCHVPALTLENPVYSEPNPYNPAGNLRVQDVARPFTFDLTREGPLPRLERTPDGKAIVRAFTDLKRHKMGPICNNEKLIQIPVPQVAAGAASRLSGAGHG